MDQPERMNLIRVDAELRCESEQAEAMIGLVDHVEYDADTGIARLHATTTSTDRLLADMRGALDRVEGVLAQAGLTDKDGLSLSIGTEELVEDNGTWRRRGELVGPIL
jgi:hypothetical protein